MRGHGARFGAGALALLLLGCGAKTGLPVPEPTPEVDATVVDVGAPDIGAPDTGVDAGPVCVPFRAEARLAALDIFLVLDSSGSMEESTAGGLPKAAAVADALGDFFTDPDSEGLGVALTFFPFNEPAVPERCTGDRDCGEPDACLMPDICWPSGDTACRDDADCTTAGDRCVPLGICADDTEAFCLPDEGLGCEEGIACDDYGVCLNRASCDVARYATPAVDLAELPGAAPALLEAIRARPSDGGTPTLPAMVGALERARLFSEENPGDKVIVLLATDGLPTACDPAIDPWVTDMPEAGIPAVTAVAADGARDGIETFVVGVFAPDEEMEARANLSAIARSGGTEEALVITTDESVTDRLLEILRELRLSVRTCVYAIPHEGVLPDPRELEVRILPPTGLPIELVRRDGPEGCDPRFGGFYFEQDIGAGARPGFVELCPASCSLTAASDEFVVEMAAGCDLAP